ncbi:MAG: hypothetical protein ACRC28_07600 [Clostridium sp.]|uniref:hypothetical protein n=1 Tax=Clostridium sp. TaxID=1506 RepID=UPI003F3C5FC6
MKKLIKVVLVLCVLMQFYSVACDMQKEKIENNLKVEKEKEDLEKSKNKEEAEALNKVEKKEEKKDISKDVVYNNERFGFSVVYPGFFEIEEEGFNNEGITVWDKNKTSKLVIFGENNLDSLTTKEMLEKDLKYLGKADFKREKKEEYAISWKSGSKIFYKMIKVGKGSTVGFLIEYPSKEKKKYDSIISNLCKNLKTPNLAESH